MPCDRRAVPLELTARLARAARVQALVLPAYRGRSFDIRSKLEGEGEVTTDFDALIEKLGGKNCDYSLGVIA